MVDARTRPKDTKSTLIQLLIGRARDYPNRIALRTKRYGIWAPMSWSELWNKSAAFGLFLKTQGLKPGDCVVVLGGNTPEWLIAELGTLAAGGVVSGINPDALVEETRNLIEATDARFLVAGDQEQVDKLLKIWDGISSGVGSIIVWDSRGMNDYYRKYPFLRRFEECLQEGSQGRPIAPEEIVHSSPDDIAMMLATSGTTAEPKLVLLSHRNLIFLSRSLGEVIPMDESDEVLSLAPLAWISEQLYSVVCFLDCGFRYNFPASGETLRHDLIDLQPTYVGGTPSRWEDIASRIQASIDHADFLKRTAYKTAITLCQEAVEKELSGEAVGFWKTILGSIARFLVTRPLTKQVGLGRVKVALTGWSGISPDIFKFFKALGIDLRQVYGLAECSAFATCHREGDVRPDSAGVALPGVTVRISESGEILVGGEGVMAGYYKNSEANAQSFTTEGLLRTGDTGSLDQDGHLFVFDRIQDMIRLSDGTRLSPQNIETRLKFSPYIKEAVVVGEGRPYLSALISIDPENVGNWVKKKGVVYTTFQDLAQKPEVYQLIQGEIVRLVSVSTSTKIRRFANLIKELHPDDGELTRDRKLRRALIKERCEPLIRALYNEQKDQLLDIQVRFEDGHESILSGRVTIMEIG